MSSKHILNLVWLDMEMTGLDISTHVILEAALIVTDANLNILAQSQSYAIYQSEEELEKMDNWNLTTHTKSGLIERVKNSLFNINQVEEELLQILKKYIYKGIAPLCGNSIHQDRKFLSKYMSNIDNYLHYRNLDVSSIKEIAKRWYPNICTGFKKNNKHEALADIHETIEELKYYREKIFIQLQN